MVFDIHGAPHHLPCYVAEMDANAPDLSMAVMHEEPLWKRRVFLTLGLAMI